MIGRVATNGLTKMTGGKKNANYPFIPVNSSSSILVQQLFPPSSSIVGCQQSLLFSQQSRHMSMTKTKRRQRDKMAEREKRIARGLPAKPNPPKFIPKSRPVIGALSREERDDEARRSDAAAAEEMKVKIARQVEADENLRFGFDGLEMSERVRKLFALKNGSQSEVVWSQKRRGMEVSVEETGIGGCFVLFALNIYFVNAILLSS